MNLLIFAVCIVLATISARPRIPARIRWITIALQIGILIAAPFITRSTGILFDALTAMCIAYGWNFIGGYTGYASFGNVAYLGLGAFVAAGVISRPPGPPPLPWVVAIPPAGGDLSPLGRPDRPSRPRAARPPLSFP